MVRVSCSSAHTSPTVSHSTPRGALLGTLAPWCKVTPRTLADWTPDAGDVDAWLAEWAGVGWVRIRLGRRRASLGGQQDRRWAMILREPAAAR